MDLTNKKIRRRGKKLKEPQEKIEIYNETPSNIMMLPVADLLVDPMATQAAERLFPGKQSMYFRHLVPGLIQYIENFWVADNTVHCLIVYQDDTSSPNLSYLGHPTDKKLNEGSVRSDFGKTVITTAGRKNTTRSSSICT